MMDNELLNLLTQILTEVVEMVKSHVDKKDLTGRVDYVSIYAHSKSKYDTISTKLLTLGTVGIVNNTGNYYELIEPLLINNQTIRFCRVRKPDSDHLQRGYADFEVVNYDSFKAKYLPKQYFSLLTKDEEMIELHDPQYNVRAYFLSGKFYLD